MADEQKAKGAEPAPNPTSSEASGPDWGAAVPGRASEPTPAKVDDKPSVGLADLASSTKDSKPSDEALPAPRSEPPLASARPASVGQSLGGLGALVSGSSSTEEEAVRAEKATPDKATPVETKSEPQPDATTAPPAEATAAPKLGVLHSLADLASVPPPAKVESEESASVASPFDVPKASSSKYTYVMNSADLKDVIGDDPNRQRLATHSSSSAGYESRTSQLPEPAKPVVTERPRAAPRRPTTIIQQRQPQSGTSMFLIVVAIVLGFVLMLMWRERATDRNALLEPSRAVESTNTGGN